MAQLSRTVREIHVPEAQRKSTTNWFLGTLLTIMTICVGCLCMEEVVVASKTLGSWLIVNWVWTGATLGSAIAAGLGTWVAVTWVPSNSDELSFYRTYRYRNGPNIRKKYYRWGKRSKPNIQALHYSGIPAIQERGRMNPDTRFNDIGRRRRAYQGPTNVKLSNQVQRLTVHVKELNDDYWELKDRTNKLEERLVRAMARLPGTPDTEPGSTTCTYPHTPVPRCSMASAPREIPTEEDWPEQYIDFTAMTPYEREVHNQELERRHQVHRAMVQRRGKKNQRGKFGHIEWEAVYRSTPQEIEELMRKGEVLFDSGANCYITFDKTDFSTFVPGGGNQIDGIGKGLRIEGRGTIKWTFRADNGTYRTLFLPGYYVPSTTNRIASTQVILAQYPSETIQLDSRKLYLSGRTPTPIERFPGGVTMGGKPTPPITVTYNTETNLPMAVVYKQEDIAMNDLLAMACKPWETWGHRGPRGPDGGSGGPGKRRSRGARRSRAHTASTRSGRAGTQSRSAEDLPTQQHASVTATGNINLSTAEKELLRWHQCLGHVSIRRVQWMMKQGMLSNSEATRRLHTTAAKLEEGPMCTACQYAKQRRKTTQG